MAEPVIVRNREEFKKAVEAARPQSSILFTEDEYDLAERASERFAREESFLVELKELIRKYRSKL